MTREEELAQVARDVGERLAAYVATGKTPNAILELEERAELAARILLALEWISPRGAGIQFPFCPACDAMRDVDGDHHEGCALAAVIALLAR